ncbi:MAG: hypothetical protein FWF13_06045 [Acidobacteria bacterium]|nr:hypothetical protein [Acidobacteriota bacterium]
MTAHDRQFSGSSREGKKRIRRTGDTSDEGVIPKLQNSKVHACPSCGDANNHEPEFLLSLRSKALFFLIRFTDVTSTNIRRNLMQSKNYFGFPLDTNF